MTGPPAMPPHGAVILQWPSDAEARDELARQHRPRLLVLEAGEIPPAGTDELEDWIWLPADERDVFSRLRELETRAARTTFAPGAIDIGEDGSAWIAGTHLHLPAAESALLRLLSDPPDRLRTREELGHAAWGDVPHQHRSLDSRIFVLRRRVTPLGVSIHAIRGRGFVLTLPGSSTSW